MPAYCLRCGEAHSTGNNQVCEKKRKEGAVHVTRSVMAAACMAAKSTKEEIGEVAESLSGLSLEERERRTLEAIKELEAEMRVSQLEEQLEKLREEQCRRRTWEDRGNQDVGGRRRSRAGSPSRGRSASDDQGDYDLPPPTWREDCRESQTEHSNYGCSRHRSCDRTITE